MITIPINHFEMVIPFLLVLARISALLMSMPIIQTKMVSSRIKVMMSLAISVVIFFQLDLDYRYLTQLPFTQLVLNLIYQLIIGVAFGFIVNLIFQSFILAGQIISMQMGLGFAQLVDPLSGISVPALGQFYLLLVTLFYLGMDGHLYIISELVHSFSTIPLDMEALTQVDMRQLVDLVQNMFVFGLKIALPITIALLITNCIFGIIAKASPQINIFSLGFSFTLLVGILLIWVTLPITETIFLTLTQQFHESLEHIIHY